MELISIGLIFGGKWVAHLVNLAFFERSSKEEQPHFPGARLSLSVLGHA